MSHLSFPYFFYFNSSLCYDGDYGGAQDGTTALMRASFCGSAATVEILLEAGADMNMKNTFVSCGWLLRLYNISTTIVCSHNKGKMNSLIHTLFSLISFLVSFSLFFPLNQMVTAFFLFHPFLILLPTSYISLYILRVRMVTLRSSQHRWMATLISWNFSLKQELTWTSKITWVT